MCLSLWDSVLFKVTYQPGKSPEANKIFKGVNVERQFSVGLYYFYQLCKQMNRIYFKRCSYSKVPWETETVSPEQSSDRIIAHYRKFKFSISTECIASIWTIPYCPWDLRDKEC